MALYFLDTSSATKLYVSEIGTSEMVALVQHPDTHNLAILSITVVEFRSAVRRRQRTGSLDEAQAAVALTEFHSQLRDRIDVRPVTNDVFSLAEELIDRHPLKASDAIQLAGCLMLRAVSSEAPTFVASDHQLLRSAAGEGLSVLNPAV